MMKFEELPATPSKPELVQTAAGDAGGLDLLGLRSPAEGIAVRLLDGVTTVTPTVRYLSLRCWIILRYLRLGGLNDSKQFLLFAAKVEAAIAFASVLGNDATAGIIGTNLANKAAQDTTGQLTLKHLTKNLAVSIYAGPSENLGLGDTQGRIPGLTKERGLRLAENFDSLVRDDEVLYAITIRDDEQAFSTDQLSKLHTRLIMAQPVGSEREQILRAILPLSPRKQELPRIASYCLLLLMCQRHNRLASEADLFEVVSAARLDEIPAELHLICDGWTRFLVRDLIVLVHEAALNSVLGELARPVGNQNRRPYGEVLETLTAIDFDPTFNGLGLGGLSADDPISKLYSAVTSRFANSVACRGISRWEGEITEIGLIQKQHWLTQPSGLALLPIAWIVSCHRLAPGVVAQMSGFDIDGMAGISRFGIGGVLMPEVKHWATSNRTIRETIAWLLKRSVDQHLRIAWSRLAHEPQKDVSLLQSDGDDWIYIKDFRAGRATSRLYQALNWCGQLGLVDDNGITSGGKVVLEEMLATLRREGGTIA